MIDFMLQGSGEEAPRRQGDGLSFEIKIIHLDTEAASNGAMQAREAEASLVLILPTAGQGDDGIAKEEGHVYAPINRFSVQFHGGGAFLNFSKVNQANLKGDADLGGGKTDTLRLTHGVLEDS